MDHHAYARQIAADVARMSEVVTGLALSSPVPSCPGWDVRELLRHLGGVHTWARSYVSDPRPDPIRESLEEQVGGWPGDDDLVSWFRGGGLELAAAIDDADPGLATWTFLDAKTPLLHWARRQTHETAIHRVDAELAAGVDSVTFPTAIAVDGIHELLTAFITRPRRGPRHPTPVVLEVTAADVDQAWTVRFDAESCRADVGGADDADLRVRGSADTLYRWVWNRVGHDAVELRGDTDLAVVWAETVQVKW